VADACEHAEHAAEPERRSDSLRACSVNAFSLPRSTTGNLSRAADVVSNQQLHARAASAYERRQFPGVRVAAATRCALGLIGRTTATTRCGTVGRGRA
jgi:hypothetical protein